MYPKATAYIGDLVVIILQTGEGESVLSKSDMGQGELVRCCRQQLKYTSPPEDYRPWSEEEQ